MPSFRLFESGDTVTERVAKGMDGHGFTAREESEMIDGRRTRRSDVSFGNLLTPVRKSAKATAVVRPGGRVQIDDEDRKRARKGEVPPGTISGDPVLGPSEDEDDDDAKRAARARAKAAGGKDEDDDDEDAKRKRKAVMNAIRAEAQRLDDEDNDEEDEKKKKLKAFAKKLGVGLKGDDDEDDEDDADGKDMDGTDDMSDSDRKARGLHATRTRAKSRVSKVSFSDIIIGHDAKTFPLEQQEGNDFYQPGRRTRGVDTGVDALGRAYDDNDYVTTYAGAGGLSIETLDDQMLPEAGAGPTWEGDTRRLSYEQENFFRPGEGNRGRVGGEDRGVRPARPNLGRDGAYTMEEEDLVPEGGAMVPTSLPGGMRVMNPKASGIAPASGYKASTPTLVLKSAKQLTSAKILKSKPGLFRSVLNSPLSGFAPDGGIK